MLKIPENKSDIEELLYTEIAKLIEETKVCEPEQRIKNIELLLAILNK